jgi:hypothetical protein
MFKINSLTRNASTIALAIACMVPAMSAGAQTVTDTTACNYEDLPTSIRQTLIVIDGNVITHEDKGSAPNEANNEWRGFLRQFLDAANPEINSRMAPREYLTLAMSNPDGSGMTTMFAGCIPTFSAEEDAVKQENDSAMGTFFGSSWKNTRTKMAEEFVQSASRGIIEKTQGVNENTDEVTAFAEGALVRSMKRSQQIDASKGIPRVIFYTDLSKYSFPDGDASAVRRQAFADAKAAQIDLGRSEVHVMSEANPETDGNVDYLPAFLLGSKAELKTLQPANGSLSTVGTPVSVEVYTGSVRLGGSEPYPARMRLATDINGQLVNSWIEETRTQSRYVPIEGQLSCAGGSCDFIGKPNFGMVWAENTADSEAMCGDKAPFGGMRILKFQKTGDEVTGQLTDTVCYIEGGDDNVAFDLKLVPNGQW